MDIGALKGFVTVTRAGSFTKAAEIMGSQKATLSRAVSRLEATYKVQLLQRSTRSLRLTEAGRELYERGCLILSALDDTVAALERTHREPSGHLKLTCGHEFGQLVVSRWVSGYIAEYTEVQVQVDLTNRFVDLIHEGFDLAIRVGVLPDSSLSARKLGDVEYGLFASPSYIEKNGVPAAPDELPKHALVAFTPGGKPTWDLVNGADVYSLAPESRFIANDNLFVRRIAADGHGIALLPNFQAAPLLSDGALARVLPEWSRIPVPVHAVFASSRFLSPKVRQFINFARRHFKETVD